MSLGRVGEGEGGGRNAPDEPEETLGGGVLLGLELVPAEVLDVLRLGGGRELPIADFLQLPSAAVYGDDPASWLGAHLDVAEHVILDGGEGDGAEDVCRC